MSFVFNRVRYEELDARQKEAFNFQKVSAVLADYGFVTLRLSSDWQGADFIAQHRDGEFLQGAVEGPPVVLQEVHGRDLYVCFPNEGDWFIYPHDELLARVLRETEMGESDSWQQKGGYTYPGLSKTMRELLEPYRTGRLAKREACPSRKSRLRD